MNKLLVSAIAVFGLGSMSLAADTVVAVEKATPPAATAPAPRIRVVNPFVQSEIFGLNQLTDLTDAQKVEVNKILADALKSVKEKLTPEQVKALEEAAKRVPQSPRGPGGPGFRGGNRGEGNPRTTTPTEPNKLP